MGVPSELEEQTPAPDAVQEKPRPGKARVFLLSQRVEKIARYLALFFSLLYAYALFHSFAYWSLFPFTIPREIEPADLCPMAVLGAWMLLIAHFTIVRSYGVASLLSFLGLMMNAIIGKNASPSAWLFPVLVASCAYFLMCTQTFKRRLERESRGMPTPPGDRD
jgi:hypothetical protein